MHRVPRSLLTIALALAASSPVAAELAPFTTPAGVAVELVPEMETPTGILYQWTAEREALRESSGAPEAERVLTKVTRDLWPDLRTLDLLALSRYQLEATEGWALPDDPGELRVETVGRDPETGALHVEVRGPRLPARYDIVFRYLHLYGVVDPGTGTLERLVVTIRGWVEE